MRWALGGLLLTLAACQSPQPTESLLELRTRFGTVYALSTEAGIVALPELVEDVGDEAEDAAAPELSFRYHIGNGFFDDVAVLEHRHESLVFLRAVSTRPNEARFALYPARLGDDLYLEACYSDGDPQLLQAALVQGGQVGNLLTVADGRPPAVLAQQLAGAGVFALRDGYLQVVGVLNGVVSDEPPGLTFIGLDEIARALPRHSSYLERRALVRRADFEYARPRELTGERVHAAGYGPVPEYPAEGEGDDLGLGLEGFNLTEEDFAPPPDPSADPDAPTEDAGGGAEQE